MGEEPGLLLGQVVKRDVQRRVVRVERRIVRGPEAAIAVGWTAPHSGTGITTADIARLNATVRAALAPLGRRGRAIAHTEAILTAGMWLVGGASHVEGNHVKHLMEIRGKQRIEDVSPAVSIARGSCQPRLQPRYHPALFQPFA